MGSPIKRHTSLIPISREHHFGLLLSWKIREGLKYNVNPARIMDYCVWFYNTNLKLHFDIEEQYMYPILGNDHPMIVQALHEHRHIEQLILQKENVTDVLLALEKAIDTHIRFEERNLFNLIQEKATEDQLRLIEQNHNAPFEDTWEDTFWVKVKS
jgi:hemerythrin-like domain-containing protein